MEKFNLYKYYAPESYNFDALERGYWFFKQFGYANDPFDCDWNLLDIIHNKWGLKSDDIQKDAALHYAICSFSDSPVNKHLWALYCCSYKGFVVEFEYTENDYLSFSQKGLPLYLCNVSYVDKDELEKIRTIPTLRLIPPVQENMSPERQAQHEKDNLFIFLYSIKEKSTWSAECEKRILLGNRLKELPQGVLEECTEAHGYKVYFSRSMIKRIIAGTNISDENLQRPKIRKQSQWQSQLQ